MTIQEKANAYIETHRIPHKERPAFHVTPPVGWMNDPNGFSEYQGKIHLFYQFHPYSTDWGPMHWGHYVSSDLIHWEELPVALAPDQSFDQAGCFSGSAIETQDGHILVYTGVSHAEENGEQKEYQNQCIAVGNGTTYKKLTRNPVILGSLLPDGFNTTDFRDPKIWQEDGIYYLIAGNRDSDRQGQVVLFSSKNLLDWKYENILAHSDLTDKNMWECPDFFELDGHHILICSPQDMKAEGYEFHNGHNSIYFTGTYNKTEYTFAKNAPVSLDYGLDFYAPQTTKLSDGRRVMIGWMQSWNASLIPADQKWQGMMTLPRELTMVDGILFQTPIKELEKYRTEPVFYSNEKLSGKRIFTGISGRMLDMTVVISEQNFDEFCIDLAHNEDYTTRYTFFRKKNIIEVDRTYSGVRKDVICQRKMQIKSSSEELKLRLIMDRFSIELFVNDGSQVSSTAIYTPQDADGIVFSCDGETTLSIEKYSLQI